MSIKITGGDDKTVKKLQSRLDKFFSCNKAHEEALKRLNECAAEQIELANIPAHEDRYQILLSQYKISAEALKARAEKTARKTNEKHTDKYFKKRHNSWFGTDHYYINPDFSDDVKGINQDAQKLLAFDFETHIAHLQNASQRKKTEAQATIEYSLIDQTFPSHSAQLLKENPVEYLRQASLYQQKLLEKKDETAVLAFGNSWIKNLPKDATWDQIENMSFIMLEAAKTSTNAELTQYRETVAQWIKEHPLAETPESVDPTQATSPWGRRTYILGRLYVYHRDLSPEAFQIYQRCSSLYPDLHGWKILQAQYHISRHEWLEAERALAGLPQNDPSVKETQRDLKVTHSRYQISKLQWLEAKQLLADLPQDDASVRDAQRDLDYYLRERFSSLVMDVGVIALSKYMPSSYREKAAVDVTLTGLQLGTSGTVRQMWVPRLLGDPDRAIPPNPFLLPLSSRFYMAGDVIDCAFRNITWLSSLQSYESFASYTLRLAHAAGTFYTNPLQRSIAAAVNLGSLFISSFQSLDACRGIRRSAVTQASLSGLQLMASNITFGVVLASYSDLLPVMASSIGANSLADRISIDLSSEGEESSKNKWVIGALVIGSVAAFRLYCDYPYLWAAAVMRDIEFHSSQGKYEEVQKVLADAENKYFVSSVRPAVKDYALYAEGLKDYPSCLEDPIRSREFLMQLDLVLNILKASSHYRGIRNNLLLKKMEAAIRKQDRVRLEEVYKEGPEDKIATSGFHFFLNSTFALALSDIAAACSLIVKMKPAFPKRFHPDTDSFLELFQDHSESIEEWSQLNVLTGQQKEPFSSEKADKWNEALQKLQDFFSQNVGKADVYQDLQYYKLMIMFAQKDKAKETADLFQKSDPELHQRFSHASVHCTRQLRKVELRKVGMHQLAIDLLKRAEIDSFKYRELIQNYGHFFSLLSLWPLQREAVPEQMQKLESCLSGLDAKDECHQELRVFFESCRIVLSLEAGEYAKAKELLAQENTDSKVPDEVAALLFERMFMRMRANGLEVGLNELSANIENLGTWQHQELFQAYHAYLVCEPSLEATVESLTAVITQMTPIEQLSDFVANLQLRRHPMEFKLRLSQGDFATAKNLLNARMPKKLRLELCNSLFIYFIYRRFQERETVPLREVTAKLQSLNTFFASPNSNTIQSYINFLVLLDSLEEKKEIVAHQTARQSLWAVFMKLNSIQSPIPELLKDEWVNINLKIARLAKASGQRSIGLAALESIRQVIIPGEQLAQYIDYLTRQLNE